MIDANVAVQRYGQNAMGHREHESRHGQCVSLDGFEQATGEQIKLVDVTTFAGSHQRLIDHL